MGRSCILFDPLRVHSPSIPAKKAVRKRMAVPAAFTSKTFELELNASMMTWVSSQSDRFVIGLVLKLNALRIRARLLILFEAGNVTAARIASGGKTVY